MSAHMHVGTRLDKIKWSPSPRRRRGQTKDPVIVERPLRVIVPDDVSDELDATALLARLYGDAPLEVGLVSPWPRPLEELDVGELWCDALRVSSVSIDWGERMGEDGDGWCAYDAQVCDGCDQLVVGVGNGEMQHCDVADVDCDATLCFSEPMMSYHYPVLLDDPEQAAIAIADLPLCVVRFDDRETSLALTGGGMDLSWEICEAFMRVGRLPPARFARLPEMGGRGTSARDLKIVEGCRASFDALKRDAERGLERLDEMLTWARSRGNR